MPLHFSTFYEVIRKQERFLPEKTNEFIQVLNRIYDQSEDIIKKYDPTCFILLNMGQNSFELSFGIRDQKGELKFFYHDFEMVFNDGDSFGLESFEMEIPEHPTEDLFYSLRAEVLHKLFYAWIVESVWNSQWMNLPVPIIYSDHTDCDKLIDLRVGWLEYENFDFLKDS